jgi:hypothetical protein
MPTLRDDNAWCSVVSFLVECGGKHVLYSSDYTGIPCTRTRHLMENAMGGKSRVKLLGRHIVTDPRCTGREKPRD